jgi:FemAB-related protein (PEP-CTERM system-associated)
MDYGNTQLGINTRSNIIELEDGRRQDWDQFIDQASSSTCFHPYGWRIALRDVLGYETHYAGIEQANQLAAVIPFAVVKSKLFGTTALSLPFCTYGGPVARSSEHIEELLAYAKQTANAAGATYFHQRLLNKPEVSSNNLELYYAFRKPLPEKLDEMKFIPSKRRNMVRKASQQGLTSNVSRDVGMFFELYAENARAHGTPALPRKFFDVLVKELGERCDILFVHNGNGEPISCIMNFYHRGEIHAGFAGENSLARKTSANDFKYWKLVEHAVSKGCKLFDFGRSKKETGSFEFKRLWGFEPSPLFYEYDLFDGSEIPQTNPNNPKYKAVMAVWSRLPRMVVDRVGPLIIHGLG